MSFALLAAVLVGGTLWYERSRPPAKLVAMVAALAALAVAGRVALAPIPNVVATTDIVLLSGYALGGAPAFAIGALAALVSNFWLGQGPWTPWQMAGWGLVGVGGAALARMTGRRLGRLGLAACCALAGLAYGALLDLSVMVTYGGEQSLDRYLALSARGVPFNVAHALGNAAFALIAGPALVAMLLRFRERLEVTWRAPAPRRSAAGAAATLGAVLVALSLLAGLPGAGIDAPAKAQETGSATSWLAAAQNPDGGFGTAVGGTSSVEMTTWAALALAGAGSNPLDVSANGNTPIDYLNANRGEIRSTNDIQRVILVLEAAGLNSRNFLGRDLLATLRDRRRPDGSFREWPNLTAFGIFALAAAGASPDELLRSGNWLRRAQHWTGGWGAVVRGQPDPDSTGAALQALEVAGLGGSSAANRGVIYLVRNQQRGGGWALTPSGAANAQSTSYAVQGLLAVGENPGEVTTAGRDPFEFLGGQQQPDGHFRYSSGSDQTPVWVTAQALLAVSRQPFPVATVARAPAGSSGAGASGGGAGTAAAGSGAAGAADAPASGSGPGSGAGPGTGRGGAPPGEQAAGDAAVANPGASEDGSSSSGELQGADPATEDGNDNSALVLIAVFGGLALALVAGFLWYRRTLP
jgi:energy-coupling factor transport system substrate-specific component